VWWCEVHRSVSDEDGCHWDRLMGPRPGRGKCQLVDVRIIDWKEEGTDERTHSMGGAILKED
jgi:hypothetical protein